MKMHPTTLNGQFIIVYARFRKSGFVCGASLCFLVSGLARSAMNAALEASQCQHRDLSLSLHPPITNLCQKRIKVIHK